MNLIDSHCHLVDEKFTDITTVIERSRAAGVEKIIIPVGNLEEARKAIEVAERHKQFAMVGIHPEEVERYGSIVDGTVKELREIVQNSKRVVGIGEIGLDFYFDKEKKTKESQIELFSRQMELAVEMKLPVVIHMRDAEEEMMEVLSNFENLPDGQFHCFAGTKQFLTYILKRGFYISFAGNITYKSAGNLRELVNLVPLERLLLETDSPYLAPEPLRGSINEPANVKIIAEFIAQELRIEANELAEITTKNAKCLYSLDI